jgi:hypothetical protein
MDRDYGQPGMNTGPGNATGNPGMDYNQPGMNTEPGNTTGNQSGTGSTY